MRTFPPTRGCWVALLSLCVSLLAACRPPDTRQAEFYVFGTLVEVSLAGVDADRASRAFGALQQDFQRMHRDWHPWEPGELTDINRAFANGQTVEAGADIVTMVRAAQEFEQKTGGRFNPAIGGLIDLWGFHTSDFPVRGPLPAPEAIAALVTPPPTTRDIEIRGTLLYDRSRRVQLDFSGLAKGLAVDQACAMLRQLGVGNALVNAGGDLRGYGRHGSRPWRIAVRNPLGGVIGTLDIREDEAVFTSGNYERFHVDAAGERYPHILDPRTGWPAEAVMSATVIAAQGMLADAAATALVVAGLAGWQEVARPLGLDAVLLTDEEGRIYATPAMLERLELADGLEATVLPPG